MNIFKYFRAQKHNNTAAIAKDRLQILLAQQRSNDSGPDYLPMMQKDIMAVIAKYIDIDENELKMHLERDDDYAVLELNITLPETGTAHVAGQRS